MSDDICIMTWQVGVQSGGSTEMWLDYFGGPDRVQYVQSTSCIDKCGYYNHTYIIITLDRENI